MQHLIVNADSFSKALLLLQEDARSMDIMQRMEALTTIILYADEQYYIKDNPVLADGEYDGFFAELKAIEMEYPTSIHPNSPTQRVAMGRSEQLVSTPHIQPMLSLDNTYNADDLQAWDKRNRESLGVDKIEYVVEPKYDGAGISLIYENDKLAIAATRGDGISGDNITVNARQIRSIPLSAKMQQEGVEQIEIRGEVVIRKATFQKLNEARAAEGLSLMANPRNAASGALRMLDPEEVKKRGLYAILYHISYINDFENPLHPLHVGHFESLTWLSLHQFATPVSEMHLCQTIEEVITWCQQYEERRDALPYEIDGMVVKVNRFDKQEKLGMTSHHPRWAVAYKFKAQQATSKLLNVEFQVGRTGTITPVGKIEPVYIGGVTISSLSLFNEDVIREKNLKINDSILVERAGDVIPYVVKSLEELRNGTELDIIFPENCPVCHTALFKLQDEVAWRCVNMNCAAQVVERMIHFASKDAMDIRTMGDANVRRFYEMGILNNVADIYQLPFESMGGLESFGAKSVENLKAAIEQSKTQTLNRLIFALGIKYVGATTAKTLARNVQHILDLKDWSIESLTTLEDVGPKVATSVYDYFQNPENIAILQQLAALGVSVEKQATNDNTLENEQFSGKTFLFTGTLSQFKRSDAEAIVEARGGKLLSGVSSKLNYLVVGTDAGSKLEKAKKLSTIQILTEAEFAILLQ